MRSEFYKLKINQSLKCVLLKLYNNINTDKEYKGELILC